MSTEEHKALARRYVEELLNRQRFERADEILAPDFVGHFPGVPGPVRGVDAWTQTFGVFLAAFPDYHETVADLVAEGDRVAARIGFSGTHRGELMGLPPTGKPVAVTGMAVLRVANGKIAEQWAEADMLGLLQQLGVVPAPGPAAAPAAAATPPVAGPSGDTEANKALVREVVDAFRRGDLGAADRFFAADYVDHSRLAQPPGPAGVKAFFAMARAAFPDLAVTIDDLVAEGDKVAVRGRLEGTHRGEFMGIPPTGKRIAVTLIDVNRVAGGRLVERWANQDDLGMLQQLGAVPAPGAPATP